MKEKTVKPQDDAQIQYTAVVVVPNNPPLAAPTIDQMKSLIYDGLTRGGWSPVSTDVTEVVSPSKK
jgi:hypothetical protein